MEHPHSFTSPETGKQYTSENPITEQLRENTLFAEKVSSLDPRNLTLKYFKQELRGAGPEALADLEAALKDHGKQFSDLSNITRRHIEEQRDAEEWVSEFLKNNNKERRKQLMGFLAPLI